MKRIIQCPQCEAKLSVFDIGKPISQKCPKCGNSIDVESEEPSRDDKKDQKDKNADGTSAVPDKSLSADSNAKNDKPPEGKANIEAKKADDKDDPPKPPAHTPLSTNVFDALSAHAPAGTGGLFKALVIGALIIIIAMQMITKLTADKHYKNLIEHLQYIEKNLGN